MFYGAVLKPGVEVSPSSEHGEILHLSQACLHNPTSNEKTYLQICQGDQSYSLCVLQKDKNENASLDLFVSAREGTRFKISGGKNEVHLVGYFEPEAGSDDDACFHSDDEDDDDEEDSDAEDTQSGASDEEMAKEGNDKDDSEDESDAENEDGEEDSDDGEKSDEDDDDDEEEDEDDDDENNDDDDDEEDEEEDDDDDEEEDDDDDEASSEEAPATPAKGLSKKQKVLEKSAAAPKGKPSPSVAATDNKKRKAETPAAKPQKLQKAADGSKVKSGPEAEFEKAISDYLKKNGRCMISVLAGKVRKPDALKAVKYQAFLKSKPQFAIDGQYISLKA